MTFLVQRSLFLAQRSVHVRCTHTLRFRRCPSCPDLFFRSITRLNLGLPPTGLNHVALTLDLPPDLIATRRSAWRKLIACNP